MTRTLETEGDDVFRADARRLGYFRTAAHDPGNGRGLRAYYRDHGMVQPEVLERDIPGKETQMPDWKWGLLTGPPETY